MPLKKNNPGYFFPMLAPPWVARPTFSSVAQATAVVRPGSSVNFSTRVTQSPPAICDIMQRLAGVKRLWLLRTAPKTSSRHMMPWLTIKMGQSLWLFNVQEKGKSCTAIVNIPRWNPGMSDLYSVHISAI